MKKTTILKINYDEIITILKQLPFADGKSTLSDSITDKIYSYIMVLYFYTIVNESLIRLSNGYETQRYYNNVKNSLSSTLLYGLQTTPQRGFQFVRRIFPMLREKGKNLEDLMDDLRPGLNRLFMIKQYQFVGLVPNYKVFFQLPQSIINQDITNHIDDSGVLLKAWTTKFGELVTNIEPNPNATIERKMAPFKKFFQFVSSPSDVHNDMIQLAQLTKEYQTEMHPLAQLRKPNRLTRYWPTMLLTLLYGPSSIMLLWNSRMDILRFVKENLFEFMEGLVINWCWVPMKNIWATVKHDDSSSIAVMSHGTLDSDMNSLTRMIVSFVLENSSSSSTVDNQLLVQQVEHGDLTQFMEIYENQLHHPMKNIISGGLVRSLLIQLQKTKVDGSLALNGIDKMLKSQQLVFSVVAMSPAVLIIYVLGSSAWKLIKLGTLWSRLSQCKDALSISMNNVERILNYFDKEECYTVNIDYHSEILLNQGLLSMEISNMQNLGRLIVPGSRRNEWNRDVEELMDMSLGKNGRLNVITRIHNVYDKYIL